MIQIDDSNGTAGGTRKSDVDLKLKLTDEDTNHDLPILWFRQVWLTAEAAEPQVAQDGASARL